MTSQTFIAVLNVTALAAIMLSMGFQVKVEDVAASARQVWLVVLGIVANYLLVPVVTLVLLHQFEADPLVAIGFFILAVCPGAPVGPPITALAKGNVALAIGMMVILAGLSAIVSPALLIGFVARIAPESELQVDYLAIVRTLLVAQMLPLGLALVIHHWAPRTTARLAKPVGIAGNLLVLLLVALIIVSQFQMLAAIRLRGWLGMTILLFASLGIGWLCGGAENKSRKAMAVTTATRNAAVGLVIATTNFAETAAVTSVVVYGLFSIVGALGYAALVGSQHVDAAQAA